MFEISEEDLSEYDLSRSRSDNANKLSKQSSKEGKPKQPVVKDDLSVKKKDMVSESKEKKPASTS